MIPSELDKEFFSDEDLVRFIKARLRAGETAREIAKALGVKPYFVASYARGDWPHANRSFLKALGLEPKRYYRRRRSVKTTAVELEG